jgi:polyhydroxybutyrate depolymerase
MKTLIFLIATLTSIHGYSQLYRDSLLVEAKYRTFNFIKPTTKRSGSLVFVLHGSGGNGRDFSKSAVGLQDKTSAENILMVYPDGYKRFWNECRKSANTPPNIENINEEAFFDAMINYFKSKYDIDDQKVFVIGMSGGGHMAYKLAMTMPEKIKAITAVVASLPDESNFDCVAKNVARPVMIINGTADELNKWEGGEIKLGNGISMGNMRSTDQTFQYWYSLAGYSGTPTKAILPDINKSDGETIEQYTFASEEKPEVVLLKVVGGKHSFPKDIDVYVYSWEFFKRQKN